MTTDSSYRAAVERALRRDYGITTIRRSTNSKSHELLKFDYAGQQHVVSLNTHNAHGPNILAMKLQDIRRELGPPSTQPDAKPRRTLTQMTNELQTRAAHPSDSPSAPAHSSISIGPSVSIGRAALSTSAKGMSSLWLEPPKAFEIPVNTRYSVHRLESLAWELVPAPANTSPKKTVSLGKKGDFQISSACEGLEPFGRSPAEFLYESGHIIARVPPETLAPVNTKHRRGLAKTPTTATTPPPPPTARALNNATPKSTLPDEAALRSALDVLNHALELCPWLRVERVAATGRLRLAAKIE